ncbi:MAG TPA: hypothetical protein VMB71_11265 [Acetobacteraceae bacterium]|nr:hypothetical protein [Acetobacteraceae bacterium]
MQLPNLLLAAVLCGVFAGPASAHWTRSGSVTTPRGVYTGNFSGGCAGGTCSRQGTVTGPYGYSASRYGSVTRTAPGQYSSTGSATGPYGGVWSRTGSTSCAGGTCNHTGTITGPNGGSVDTQGSATWTPR